MNNTNVDDTIDNNINNDNNNLLEAMLISDSNLDKSSVPTAVLIEKSEEDLELEKLELYIKDTNNILVKLNKDYYEAKNKCATLNQKCDKLINKRRQLCNSVLQRYGGNYRYTKYAIKHQDKFTIHIKRCYTNKISLVKNKCHMIYYILK